MENKDSSSGKSSHVTLYANDSSQPSRAVMIFCDLNGIKYEKKVINVFAGEQFSPEYKKLNPASQVPCLVDGDFVISESHTILKYLHATRNCADHWYPSDILKRTKIDEILDWHHTNLREGVHTYILRKIVYPMMGKETPEWELKDLLKKFKKSCKYLNTLLKSSDYLFGKEMTIADLAIFSEFIDYKLHPDFDVSSYPELQKWSERMQSVPEVVNACYTTLKGAEKNKLAKI
ncbi:unnamed protein product [Moneuplotes crassus]|uniref:Uncharacterized protein n=1 Tax=Euplotes crassus TaxID=5936 RepID=A0AAD2D4Y1_EUPCR|nr:unnamed protein product [Moneuplotes crassus]